jgi:hypothetical protein
MTYFLHSFKKKKEFQIKIIFFFKAASKYIAQIEKGRQNHIDAMHKL